MTIERALVPFTPDDYDATLPAVRTGINRRLINVREDGVRTPKEKVDGHLFAAAVEPYRASTVEESIINPSTKNIKQLFKIVVLREALEVESDSWIWRDAAARARAVFGEEAEDFTSESPYEAVGDAVRVYNEARGEQPKRQKNEKKALSEEATIEATLIKLGKEGRINREHFLALRRLLYIGDEPQRPLRPEDNQRFQASISEIATRVGVLSNIEYADKNTEFASRLLRAIMPKKEEGLAGRRLNGNKIQHLRPYLQTRYPTQLDPKKRTATEAGISSFLALLYPPVLKKEILQTDTKHTTSLETE